MSRPSSFSDAHPRSPLRSSLGASSGPAATAIRRRFAESSSRSHSATQVHSDSEAEAEQQDRDRLRYISFLEGQVSRVDSALQQVHAMEAAMAHLLQAHATTQQKIAASSVELLQAETAVNTLRAALAESETRSTQALQAVEQRMANMERIYAGFGPTDVQQTQQTGPSAAAASAAYVQPSATQHPLAQSQHQLPSLPSFTSPSQPPSAQSSFAAVAAAPAPTPAPSVAAPTGLPAFVAAHVAATVAAHTQVLKAELHSTLAAQMRSEQTATMQALIADSDATAEARTDELLATTEKRWLGTLDGWLATFESQRRQLSASVGSAEARLKTLEAEVAAQNRSVGKTLLDVQAEQTVLIDQFASLHAAMDENSRAGKDLSARVDHGMAEFNAGFERVVSALESKLHTTEMLVARLSSDTLARQETFASKIESGLASKLEEQSKCFEVLSKAVEKTRAKTESRIQIMAAAIKDRVSEPVHPAPAFSATSPALSAAFSADLAQLGSKLESTRGALEAEVIRRDAAVIDRVERDRREQLKVDKGWKDGMESRLYALECMTQAQQRRRTGASRRPASQEDEFNDDLPQRFGSSAGAHSHTSAHRSSSPPTRSAAAPSLSSSVRFGSSGPGLSLAALSHSVPAPHPSSSLSSSHHAPVGLKSQLGGDMKLQLSAMQAILQDKLQ